MKKQLKMLIYFLVIFVLVLNQQLIFAAPDPAEVEEIKKQAPLQVTGEVISDNIYQDFSDDKHPYQIRVMELKVSNVEKAPQNLNAFDTLEIYYKYIPSWDSGSYVGGKRMDIAVHDVIEIWLEKGEFGWESALWGNTVSHIKYVENRNESIPEPFWHEVKRKTSEFLSNHTGGIVLFFLIAIVGFVIILGMKRRKR